MGIADSLKFLDKSRAIGSSDGEWTCAGRPQLRPRC